VKGRGSGRAVLFIKTQKKTNVQLCMLVALGGTGIQEDDPEYQRK